MKPLVIRYPLFWLGGAVLIGTALCIMLVSWATPHWEWFRAHVPVKQFIPACELYDFETSFSGVNALNFLEGEPTEEFWSELRNDIRKAEYEDEQMFPERSSRSTIFISGKVYTPLSWFDPTHDTGKYDDEPEKRMYYWTMSVAYRIYQKRLAAGRFDGVDMSDFKATPSSIYNRDAKTDLMAFNECGFLEELIMRGGRFAEP
ncbi:hypothetical protein HH303_15345 [Rhodospirillaceae bacterium KN72]|uniref:Uncharacterized protein n=1 Tax=Pacificispira spongiicola TaxID=2729598 RepID=A0A7Y0E3P4_9PROT|nr:hypothetical protein [Pacificispira spongiicola]NMM45871.1 hypothetical protein [Pacificispira spongiicola]